MRSKVYRADKQPLDLSPFTSNGQPVYSTIRTFSKQDEPIHYIETLTPDASDAIKVLQFLDEMNGIGWTPELRRLERELRDALNDLMTVEGENPQ